MKKILLILFILNFSLCFSQNTEETNPNWTKKGIITFLINQSSFDNWIAGGITNISGSIGLNYDFNYQKNDWTWENKLIANFGLTKIKNQDTQKSSDVLEWNSVVGKKAKGYWKKSDNLKVNIAPATSRLIVVDKNLTEPNEAYFGVEEGKSTRYELGASVGAYYKFNLMENISVENILNLYSNYLEDPQNVDLDYTMNMIMKINKFISANLSYQTIYDDNAFRGLQTRQVFGIGINYIF